MSKKILINFPTNIGDTILGLPALDALKANFPDSPITAISSPHTDDFLSKNSYLSETIMFDKHWNARRKCKFSFSLRAKFDIVVDLKNSFLPLIVGGRHTPFIRKVPESMHAKDRNLALLAGFCSKETTVQSDFVLDDAQRARWDTLGLNKAIFIACASRHFSKTYPHEYLSQVIDALKDKHPLVILGADTDRQSYKDILTRNGVVDLVGKTKLTDVFYLLKRYARLLLCVDSSILHLASYLNVPIVALFGPTNELHYGPWSKDYTVLKNPAMPCVPCQDPHCKFNSECMQIEPVVVTKEISSLLQRAKGRIP